MIVADTESCFGSDIYVLNLGCGIVMTLQEQKKKKAQEDGVESFDDSDNEDDNDDDNEKGSREGLSSKQSTRLPVRKYLWLPARSLLVLSGPARYCWSHGIAPRTTDKVHQSVGRSAEVHDVACSVSAIALTAPRNKIMPCNHAHYLKKGIYHLFPCLHYTSLHYRSIPSNQSINLYSRFGAKVNGCLINRGKRVSLTFRQVRSSAVT